MRAHLRVCNDAVYTPECLCQTWPGLSVDPPVSAVRISVYLISYRLDLGSDDVVQVRPFFGLLLAHILEINGVSAVSMGGAAT